MRRARAAPAAPRRRIMNGNLTALAALTLALALAAPPAAAQPQTGVHIVRRGENLRKITAQYLGSQREWERNWRLNPDIEDPDRLEPGQRIRVWLEPQKAIPTAKLTAVSGQVEGKPVPLPWNEAREQDLMVERDGLRTRAKSSTGLEFTDGTSVVLSEESLIFLRRTGRTLAGIERKTVEIVEGQAEVESRATGPELAEIEILVGGTRATSKITEDGRAQARARRAPEGGARVMVYEGEGEVEAAGQKVEVPRGMGTAVPENAPPPPPEKLLPAPAALEPEAGTEWPFPNPLFAWEPVELAAGYTVEICRDPGCVELVDRRVGLAGESWRAEPLPVEELYWRVTAVSESGLDGYPSAARPFRILTDRLDTDPPTGVVRFEGSSVETARGVFYDRAVRVEISVADAQSGVESWSPRVNGEVVAAAGLAGPWASGEHVVDAVATDVFGNRGELEPVRFVVDDDPPELRWQVGDAELLEAKVGAGLATRKWQKRTRKWVKRALASFYRRLDRPAWNVLAWGSATSPIADNFLPRQVLTARQRTYHVLGIRQDRPEVLLLAPGLVDPSDPAGEPLGERLVWLTAEDPGCGEIRSMGLSLSGGDGDGSALVIEVADRLGNRRRLEWPFVAAAARAR